jgi:hypothetical protein
MPGHNGFRFDDYESISPARVRPTQRRPKEPVHETEPGSRLFSIEDSELLPESSGFQCKPVARYEQGTHVRDDRNDKRTHRFDVIRAAFDSGDINPHPLILLTDQILMTHRWIGTVP